MFSDFPEVIEDIISDGVPHFFVGPLDLALGTDAFINSLVGVNEVLPDVLDGVGIAESQANKGGVDRNDRLDIFLLFLNDMGMEGSVGLVADVALPVDEVLVVVPADQHGVGQ